MALTKHDLEQIAELFNQGFREIVIPYVDAKIEELRSEMMERFEQIDRRFEERDAEFINHRLEMNERFALVYEKIDANTALIGHYFEQCATKQELKALELRVLGT